MRCCRLRLRARVRGGRLCGGGVVRRLGLSLGGGGGGEYAEVLVYCQPADGWGGRRGEGRAWLGHGVTQ